MAAASGSNGHAVTSHAATRAIPKQDNPAPFPALAAATATVESTPTPAATPPPIALTAKAVFAVDLNTQTQLYAQNPDLPLAPASLTKIITAIVVVEHASPDAMVTVKTGDTVNGAIYSHMGLEVGDVVSVRNLLAGMMLNSAGDAALTLSEYVGGQLPGPVGTDPRQRFVDEMNVVAAQLGMKNSHFVDPDGRDEPGHVMTARDIAIAAAELFRHPLLESLVDTRTETVPIEGPNARSVTLYNTNELLGSPGVHGVKTGTTDNAGECLVLAVWRGTDRVITVVMGSTDRYGDTEKLLSYLDQQYKWIQLGRNGDIPSLNAELASKGYALAVSKTVLLSAANAAQLRYTLTVTPSSDTSRFAPQGEVVFFVGSRPILRLSIYAGDPFKSSG